MSVQIQLEPAGRTFSAESGETVLDAALRQGISLPYGCRGGGCGACSAHLLAGSISYPSGQIAALEGQRAGTLLTCQAVPTSDLAIEVRRAGIEEAPPIETRRLPGRVQRLERLTHDVMRLVLKLPQGRPMVYRAGQYLNLLPPDGHPRAFSIATAPHEGSELLELHIRRVPRGTFTAQVFETLTEKAMLRLEAPLGTFYLRERTNRPIIFIGGGTGLAPLKAMIEHAIHIGLERAIELYWGVRSERDLYLLETITHWQTQLPRFSFTPVLSEPDAAWSGRSGLVHTAVLADHSDLPRYDIYLSGPPGMVEAGRQAFIERDVPPEQLFSDAFTYAHAGDPQSG